jgi:glycosyltransferase involved in cell wall biosynthesis
MGKVPPQRGHVQEMRTLYITYNGATEPLIRSQGIPYLKGLAARGIGCVLLSFEKPSAGRTEQMAVKKELDEHGIEWKRLTYHKSPSLPATVFDILMGAVTGINLVLLRKIDVVHARATVPAVMAYIITRLTRTKFVYDERGLMAEEYADGGMWKRDGAIYRAVRSIEKMLLMRADAVVVLTENIKKFLSEGMYLPLRGRQLNIHVIPCCVDLGRFFPVPSEKEDVRRKIDPALAGKFVFIYTGSLGTWYMLDEMLDFYTASKEAIPEAHLLVVTHIGQETVREAAARHGLGPEDITITGASFDDMPVYLRAADAGIFFIRPVLSKRSSCPIKFAEYLASGLPVVINSGIGDTARIVEEGPAGVVVGGFSQEEYARAANEIKALSKDGRTAQLCRGKAEGIFSLASGIDKYEKVYESIRSSKKGKT